jgi:glucose/mannose-6-phosphate isomerase
MRNLVDKLPEQIADAVRIAQAAKLNPSKTEIQNVCISGLGGSGIGGTIVSQLTRDTAVAPIVVNKDYSIPAFVGRNTLFIASSYSGNTEETLSALEQAQNKGAEIACITSGGKLEDIATEKGYNIIKIPAGYPPRAAFGYSSVQQFKLLTHYQIISDQYMKQLENIANHLIVHKSEIIEAANQLTEQLCNSIPIIYSDSRFEGIAVRFRQQINENAKMLCWHHVIPEMNHNELVGWAPKYPNASVVIFRNVNDYSQTQKRMDFSRVRISESTNRVSEVWSKGTNDLEKAYYLVYLGDWVSVLLAEKNEIDPVEVDIITELKDKLARD